MSSKTSRQKKRQSGRRTPFIILLATILYLALFAASWEVLAGRGSTESGQLVPGEAISGDAINRSLDLRAAAKNSYQSSAMAVVQDLGSDNGLTQKVISFGVPADGLTEYGLLVQPDGPASPSGYPAIVLCHGYENPRQYSTTADYLQDMFFYARQGFAVIKPDYRGQGFSLHQGQADSAYYSMAYNTDLMSLIVSLKKTAYIDKTNINLVGHSMGAYIALRAAVLSPDIKRLVLLSGPVDSLSKMYTTYIPPSDVNNIYALQTRNDVFSKYGTPADDTVFWKYASPINLVTRIKARIQIHVGSLDQTVPPEFSADLDTVLTQHRIAHEYYVYPDGPHSLEPQRPLIWSRSLQLLKPSQPVSH
jgi:dipeptidyl aminopeptidase/acylaminoacyl peptidase